MTARIIDGKALAARVREEVRQKVASRLAQGKSAPGLATVLVGEDPASQVYVASKQKACAEAGIQSFGHVLPASTSQAELDALIKNLNNDPRVSGILVQLPLPRGLNEEKVLTAIDLKKDVDGFSPINLGHLAQKGRDPLFLPCTPAGIMRLLEEGGARLEGANALVLGRSNIVGMPVALLLVKANATVTIAHSKTKDLPKLVAEADVLVAAIGRPEFVQGSWIKPGAVIIDVGVNRIPDPSRKSGSRLVGDVAYDEASLRAGAITPVPGGVGPMTIAMLMANTLKAAEYAESLKE